MASLTGIFLFLAILGYPFLFTFFMIKIIDM